MLKTCDSYLLEDDALALEAYFKDGYQSKIYRWDGAYYSEKCPLTLLELVCLRHGSTKKGRIDAVKKMFKFMHRTPFILVPNKVAAYPTTSEEHMFCMWIFNHPTEIQEVGKGQSIITLANGEEIMVPASKYFLGNQQRKLYSILYLFENMLSTPRSLISHTSLYQSRKIIQQKVKKDPELPLKIAERKETYHLSKKKKK